MGKDIVARSATEEDARWEQRLGASFSGGLGRDGWPEGVGLLIVCNGLARSLAPL